jgi:hypothetical protein
VSQSLLNRFGVQAIAKRSLCALSPRQNWRIANRPATGVLVDNLIYCSLGASYMEQVKILIQNWIYRVSNISGYLTPLPMLPLEIAKKADRWENYGK